MRTKSHLTKPSYGIIGDMIECLIQRSVGFSTMDVRCTYEYLKEQVLDATVNKIVVIAHSQGGITLSLALDRMFVEMPDQAVSKLVCRTSIQTSSGSRRLAAHLYSVATDILPLQEIYTFGSAAAHFNNRLNPTAHHNVVTEGDNGDPSLPNLYSPPTTHVVRTIEHYCNEFDLVPRWGVLYATQTRPEWRYAGRVFVNRGASGHLFDEHYLDIMFPLSIATDERHPMNPFLDQVVAVDEQTALKRAESIRKGSLDGSMPVPLRLGRRISVVDEAERGVFEGSGRTVRQLSRLWRYVGGGEGQ